MAEWTRDFVTGRSAVTRAEIRLLTSKHGQAIICVLLTREGR